MSELTIAQLMEEAGKIEDQSVTKAQIDFDPPPAGVTYGRLISYVDLGKQKQRDFQGKPKPDTEEVRLVFELMHPKKNKHEYEKDGEKRVRYDQISVTLTKQFGTKAKYKKLFNAMTYGRDIKHMAQMLGEAFKIEIFHHVAPAKDGKPERTFVNLFGPEGKLNIGVPKVCPDPIDAPDVFVDLPVPPLHSPLQIFLWGKPTKATWDSLFIDGTNTRKGPDGVEIEVSRNWLQEKIASASNYDGSLLDQLLGGIKLEIGGAVGDEVQDEIDEVKPKEEPKKENPEFEFSSDGDEPPFDPDVTTNTKPSGVEVGTQANTAVSPSGTGPNVQTTASPSEGEDEEAALMRQLAETRAKKAAMVAAQQALQTAAAEKATTVAPKDKKADVDAALAAMGLV